MPATSDPRRFGGIARVCTEAGAQRLKAAHVMVVGLGGVGGWAVEALVRSGIGHITLVDGDTVALSNTNRQVPALEGNYGRYKAEVLKERALLINPDLDIQIKTEFVNKDNVQSFIPERLDWVVDCIDDLRGKTVLVAQAYQQGCKVAVSGGASGRVDPARIRQADLAHVKGDPLLAKLRSNLRKDYGFPRGSIDGRSQKFHIEAVYSDEPLRQPTDENCLAIGAEAGSHIGFGSLLVVTGSVGFRLASIVINDLIQNASRAG